MRAGLRGLLHERDTKEAYPAAEAALGLARRADPHVYPVIAARLSVDSGSPWLEAAAALGDPRLLPVLQSLREPGDQPDDPWVQDLEEATRRCTPQASQAGSPTDVPRVFGNRLTSGDPGFENAPADAPNTHWSHWPESGTL